MAKIGCSCQATSHRGKLGGERDWNADIATLSREVRVTNEVHNMTHLRWFFATTWFFLIHAAWATDAARRPSQRLTRPMRPGAGTTDGWGSRFPHRTASTKPSPFGDRAVRPE